MTIHLFEPNGCQTDDQALELAMVLDAGEIYLCDKCNSYHIRAMDPVNPSHYKQGAVEAIDGIASACFGLQGIEAVCTGNAIKYLWRWKQKNGVEDLKKAQWYIQKLIDINTQ